MCQSDGWRIRSSSFSRVSESRDATSWCVSRKPGSMSGFSSRRNRLYNAMTPVKLWLMYFSEPWAGATNSGQSMMDAKSSDYLARYSENHNSVEVNSTFYRIPRKSSVENWESQTPRKFRFSVKIPQSISHSPALRYDPEKLDTFLDHIKPFGDKLGPLLLQLPPRLTPEPQ